jgi:hypothetical protein
VNGCRAHRAPFVLGHKKHDTSRATNRRQITRYRQSPPRPGTHRAPQGYD